MPTLIRVSDGENVRKAEASTEDGTGWDVSPRFADPRTTNIATAYVPAPD